MEVTIKAAADFVHGRHNMRRGEEGVMPESTAKDLKAVGLVEYDEAEAAEVKVAPAQKNKMATAPNNKAATKEVKAK